MDEREVDRVARLMWETFQERFNRRVPVECHWPGWDTTSPTCQDNWRAAARAVLADLAPPVPTVVEAKA